MSVRVDGRDVLERAEDLVSALEYELRTGRSLERCECGATLLDFNAYGRTCCAGCRVELHPGASIPNAGEGRGERSPETSADGPFSVCKGADAPGGQSVRRRVAVFSAVLVALLAPLIFGGWRA